MVRVSTPQDRPPPSVRNGLDLNFPFYALAHKNTWNFIRVDLEARQDRYRG